MDSEKLQPDMRRQSVHPLVALGIFLIITVISLGDLIAAAGSEK